MFDKLFRDREPREKHLELDWDEAFLGTADWGTIPMAIRDLHLRLLALEGKPDEAERLRSLRTTKQ